MMETEEWIVGSVLLLLLVGMFYLAFREASDWVAFAETHACQKIEQSAARLGTGFTSGGSSTIVVVPGQTAYRCDDGVVYWR